MLTGMRRRPSGHSDKAKFPLWYNVAKEGDLSENPLKMPADRSPPKLMTRVRFPSPAPIFSITYRPRMAL